MEHLLLLSLFCFIIGMAFALGLPNPERWRCFRFVFFVFCFFLRLMTLFVRASVIIILISCASDFNVNKSQYPVFLCACCLLFSLSLSPFYPQRTVSVCVRARRSTHASFGVVMHGIYDQNKNNIRNKIIIKRIGKRIIRAKFIFQRINYWIEQDRLFRSYALALIRLRALRVCVFIALHCTNDTLRWAYICWFNTHELWVGDIQIQTRKIHRSSLSIA